MTGTALACKLQYPDMQSAVEADLRQLEWLLRHPPPHGSRHRHHARSPRRSVRASREELDYRREAKHVALYRAMLDGIEPRCACRARGRNCRPGGCSRSTGSRAAACSRYKDDPLDDAQPARDRHVHRLVAAVQPLRRDPRRSASRQLHGVRRRAARRRGINLLDYGCIRIFPPKFVGGVVDLYTGSSTTTTSSSCTPTRPGASSGSRAN